MTLAGIGIDDFPRWITAGGVLAILSVIATTYVKRVQLSLQEKKQDRDGYGSLIEALQVDIKTLREQRTADHLQYQRDVATVQEQHHECERRLSEVEAQLRGVHRQLVMQSSNAAISLSSPSDDVAGAARRAKKIVEKGSGGE